MYSSIVYNITSDAVTYNFKKILNNAQLNSLIMQK